MKPQRAQRNAKDTAFGGIPLSRSGVTGLRHTQARGGVRLLPTHHSPEGIPLGKTFNFLAAPKVHGTPWESPLDRVRREMLSSKTFGIEHFNNYSTVYCGIGHEYFT